MSQQQDDRFSHRRRAFRLPAQWPGQHHLPPGMAEGARYPRARRLCGTVHRQTGPPVPVMCFELVSVNVRGGGHIAWDLAEPGGRHGAPGQQVAPLA